MFTDYRNVFQIHTCTSEIEKLLGEHTVTFVKHKFTLFIFRHENYLLFLTHHS